MSQYQYKSITIQYNKTEIRNFSLINNLKDEDANGYVEFDTTHDLTHILKDSEIEVTHVRSKGTIVEYVEFAQ
jgi:hypothetical protein